MSKLIVCDHPVLQHALAGLRDKATPRPRFKELMENAGLILGLEALKGVKTQPEQVATPLKTASARKLGQPAALVAILRAGLGMMPGLSRILPEAREGHIGLYRDEKTLEPVQYYVRLPKKIEGHFVVLCDPMLATGGSASESIRILKAAGAKNIALLTLLSSRRGVARIHKDHPDVPVYTAVVDATLNAKGYIVPGLGDAGDRLFNT